MKRFLAAAAVAAGMSLNIGQAVADGFQAPLSGVLLSDAGGDGFGAGDTVEYTLPIAHTGSTNHPSLQVAFDVPVGSTISEIRGYTSFAGSFSIDMGTSPGDDRVIVNFVPPPFASGETASVLFRLTVTDAAAISMTGRLAYADADFNEVFEYTNTVLFSAGGATVEEPVVALEGALGAALLFDAGFYGTLETGESITYSAVITNTGDSLTSLVVRGVLDHNTVLIPGSVVTSAGQVVVGNAAGDERVEIALDSFAVAATAGISYAVTVAAQVTDGTRRVVGRVDVEDAASGKPLLTLVHGTVFGPVVRLVAVLTRGERAEVIGDDEEVEEYKESITIRNDGPVAVTDVTVRIGWYEPAIDEKLACVSVFPHHCKADGTPYCPDQACVAKPGVEEFVRRGPLAVGESFVIQWSYPVNTIPSRTEIAAYSVEVTATTLDDSRVDFSVAHRLQRVLGIAFDEAALSPWVAVIAVLAAGAYGYRQRRRRI